MREQRGGLALSKPGAAQPGLDVRSGISDFLAPHREPLADGRPRAGAGVIPFGQAIARRVSAGKQVVLADLNQGNADAAAEVLNNADFDVGTVTADVSSQSGHRLGALTADENKALATTPADELLALEMLQPDRVNDSLHAYRLAKRGNSLRSDQGAGAGPLVSVGNVVATAPAKADVRSAASRGSAPARGIRCPRSSNSSPVQ